MARVKITQIKSTNGSTERQKANLRSLGIHRMHETVELDLTPDTKGQLQKVLHLVKVEELN